MKFRKFLLKKYLVVILFFVLALPVATLAYTWGTNNWWIKVDPNEISSTVVINGTTYTIKNTSGIGSSLFVPLKTVLESDSFLASSIGTTIAEVGGASLSDCNATGGTVTDVDGYRIHTFTSDGTFTASADCNAEILVVAGGGGGSNNEGSNRGGGGGGAGGLIYNSSLEISTSPVSVTIGAGGAIRTNGGNSVFGSLTAIGGGAGAYQGNGAAGGSGGGAGQYCAAYSGGAGTAGQGNNGGSLPCNNCCYNGGPGAGGGGAGGPGGEGNTGDNLGGAGLGATYSISGTSVTYAAGGGGGAYAVSGMPSYSGAPNTGNGGSGSRENTAGTGGSGIVIVRYPHTGSTSNDCNATGGLITDAGGYRTHTFNSNGTFTPSADCEVEVLVVAGGGGGGALSAGMAGMGGGGGGGVLYNASLGISSQAHSVTIGAGGGAGSNGSNSVFSSLTAIGGGRGGYGSGGASTCAGYSGGSGGGSTTYWDSGSNSYVSCAGGAPTSGQGNYGGASSNAYHSGGGGGGGGNGGTGTAGSAVDILGGAGGSGAQYFGAYYGGGGGGGSWGVGGIGGTGGGGTGGGYQPHGGASVEATSGAPNTGGGGGGGRANGGSSGSGGSGVVIIRYPHEVSSYSSCKDILLADLEAINGFYEIDPDGPGGNSPFEAYCDMDNGGWTRVLSLTDLGAKTNNLLDKGIMFTKARASKASDRYIYKEATFSTTQTANSGLQAAANESGTYLFLAGPGGYGIYSNIVGVCNWGDANIIGAGYDGSCGSESDLRVGYTGTNGPYLVDRFNVDIFVINGDPVSLTPLSDCEASGGTITNINGYNVHTFSNGGTFTPSVACNAEILVVAGGGGGGRYGGGGGGGGVLHLESKSLAAQNYGVTVGNGGAGWVGDTQSGGNGGNGENSTFDDLTAIGGGGAGCYGNPMGSSGAVGGSGGGGSNTNGGGATSGGLGIAGQGYPGGGGPNGNYSTYGAGGGGGASSAGKDGIVGGKGGTGIAYQTSGVSINGEAPYYGGGGSGCQANANLSGGKGGGGTGFAAGVSGTTEIDGVANTGGGGGGGRDNTVNGTWRAGNGGSGVVIIRYPHIPALSDCNGKGGSVSYINGHRIHTFTSSGTFIAGSACNAEVLVVAGGGEGGGGGSGWTSSGGGGGAGGLIYYGSESPNVASSYSISAGASSVTVGAGGANGGIRLSLPAANGGNSVFAGITAIGGGGGRQEGTSAGSGGSGGGDRSAWSGGVYGLGTPGQGNNGGPGGVIFGAGGGGGAGAAGGAGGDYAGGAGGAGLYYSISGSSVAYAGGGGGGTPYGAGAGGVGGGGAGQGYAGTPNTGGGGGGIGQIDTVAGAGGSGIVIIRYPSTPPYKTIFGTANWWRGGEFGGLAGADSLCQTEANNAGLTGTYKAWLGDDSTSAASRLTHSTWPYKLVNGTVVANNWTDLTDGSLSAPINISASGGTSQGFVWTNSNTDGSINGSSCYNWTNSYCGGPTGLIGVNYRTDSQWTSLWPTGCCQTGSGFNCLEQ